MPSEPVISDIDLPIRQWIDRLADRMPTPGGGSVAALVGGLGSAVGTMALRFSQGRKKNDQSDEAAIAASIDKLTKLTDVLLLLVAEDQRAYGSWRAAKDLPADDPSREAALAQASEASLAAPLATMAAATRVLDAAVNIAPRCNPWLLSDLLVCGDLCVAAVRAGRYNVIANAGTEKQHAASLAEADRMLAECVANVQKLAGHATK